MNQAVHNKNKLVSLPTIACVMFTFAVKEKNNEEAAEHFTAEASQMLNSASASFGF